MKLLITPDFGLSDIWHLNYPLKNYLSQELKDKIQEIVTLVFAKNLEEGIKEAAKSGNIALIDAFHDILVDELYDQLVERKKLDRVE